MFPDVPEEQRPLLEPHLKNVQGHVTQLEQQFAPWKTLADQGVDPNELPALLGFNQRFGQAPVDTWLALAMNMQEQGVIPAHVDLEALAEAVEAEGDYGGEEGEEGEEYEYGEGEEVPPYVAELQDEIEQLRTSSAQERAERERRVSDQLFNRALDNMKSQLRDAGVADEGMPSDQFLASAMITAQGDPSKALQMVTDFRNASMKGLARKSNGRDLDMPKGAPKSPEKEEPRDSMAAASAAAQQMLAQRNREAAS
jgi:hypothetical protein